MVRRRGHAGTGASRSCLTDGARQDALGGASASGRVRSAGWLHGRSGVPAGRRDVQNSPNPLVLGGGDGAHRERS
eukprot:scaffold13031_cov101-Isochrysis_galbana.AAC.1